MAIYVKAANQISMQTPLSEEWMDQPVICNEPFCRALDPDFKQFVSPAEARRLGKVLKRALAVSLKTMSDSGISSPDAIITGTGLGSVESTEAFLLDMCQNGEQLLKPTHFMQSTHNTIGSLVAIQTKCHGYNSTYSHKQISFESALYDAWLQLNAGDISSALVGGHDGTTPNYFRLLELIDYVGNGMKGTCSEAAMAAMLSLDETDCLCKLSGVKLLHRPCVEDFRIALQKMNLPGDVVVMTGENGHPKNDELYTSLLPQILPGLPTMTYKHLFGECYSASALGFYAAAHLLAKDQLPNHAKSVLLVTLDRQGDAALTLLTK